MSVQEKLETIYNILSANNSKGILGARFQYLSDLRDIFNAGFDNDECQIFVEQLIDDIYVLSAYGLSRGFDNTVTDTINDYISIAVNVRARNLGKLKSKQRELVTRVGNLEVADSRIKEEVFKYIDTSVVFASAKISANPAATNTNSNFNRSIEILNNIRNAVVAALDGNSSKAAQYAKDINDIIIKWRKQVENGICGPASVEDLKAALSVAEKWQASLKYTKAAQEKEIDLYKTDMVDMIVKLEKYKEEIVIWEEALQREKENIDDNEKSLQKYEEERQKCLCTIDDVSATMRAKKAEQINGTISQRDYEETARTTINIINATKDQIKRYEVEINKKREICSGLKSRIWLLEKTIKYYYEYQDIAHLLWECLQKLDINQVILVVRGRAGAEISDYVQSYLTRFFRILDDYAKEVIINSTRAMENIQNNLRNLREDNSDSIRSDEKVDYDKILEDLGVFDTGNVDEVPKDGQRAEDTEKRKHNVSTFDDDDVGNR